MHVIRVRNVHEALPAGLRYLEGYGVDAPSRNGPVTVAPGPVTTVYDRPTERVLCWPGRDANPFFHFFEALWMLVGRNDLAFLTGFVKRFADFSDDGETLAGAYGERWRSWPSLLQGSEGQHRDQIERVVELLRADPSTRRAVIQMWDANRDLFPAQGKDVCCNTQLMFTVALGKANEPNRLDTMVTCRSNDIIWGAYGANAVHFSFLQEYLAARLGLAVGTLWQVSWNYHAYREVFDKTRAGLLTDGAFAKNPKPNPYALGEVAPFPLATAPEAWDEDLRTFFATLDAGPALGRPAGPADGRGPYRNPFFYEVARPLWWAHAAYKRGNRRNALEILAQCAASDWRRAAEEWVVRHTKGGAAVG